MWYGEAKGRLAARGDGKEEGEAYLGVPQAVLKDLSPHLQGQEQGLDMLQSFNGFPRQLHSCRMILYIYIYFDDNVYTFIFRLSKSFIQNGTCPHEDAGRSNEVVHDAHAVQLSPVISSYSETSAL